MRKSFRSPASLPWFFDVFCVLRQSRIHEEQSLFEGIVKSQQKGESTPVAASELARTLYGVFQLCCTAKVLLLFDRRPTATQFHGVWHARYWHFMQLEQKGAVGFIELA